MSKMSALDFLEYRYKHNVNLTEGDFVQARTMHKAEIEKSHFDAQCVYAKTGTTYESLIESSKNYYNKKFGGHAKSDSFEN